MKKLTFALILLLLMPMAVTYAEAQTDEDVLMDIEALRQEYNDTTAEFDTAFQLGALTREEYTDAVLAENEVLESRIAALRSLLTEPE